MANRLHIETDFSDIEFTGSGYQNLILTKI